MYLCVIYFQLIMDYLDDNWSENVKYNNAISIAACRLIMNIKLSFTMHLSKKVWTIFILVIIPHLGTNNIFFSAFKCSTCQKVV